MEGELQRLLDDCRVMGHSAIERVATSWRAHSENSEDAHQRVLGAVRGDPSWLAAEAAIRHMTEGHSAQIAWRAEDSETGRTAEEAVIHAALALTAGGRISRADRHLLLKPLAETLPWLLPDEMPEIYPAGADN